MALFVNGLFPSLSDARHRVQTDIFFHHCQHNIYTIYLMELEDIIRKEYPMSDEGLDLLRLLLRTVVYPKKTILVKAGEVSTSFL